MLSVLQHISSFDVGLAAQAAPTNAPLCLPKARSFHWIAIPPAARMPANGTNLQGFGGVPAEEFPPIRLSFPGLH